MPPISRLDTKRLHLEPLALSDAPAIQALFPRWEIVRYLNVSVPWPYPPDAAAGYLRDVILPAMESGKLWAWSLRLRTDPATLIGALVLQDVDDDNRGFWLTPAWWGQGLMREACDAANRFWFETLQRETLRVPKAAPNDPSRCLSRREGMRLVRTFKSDYVSGRLPTELSELTADEWRASRTHHSRYV